MCICLMSQFFSIASSYMFRSRKNWNRISKMLFIFLIKFVKMFVKNEIQFETISLSLVKFVVLEFGMFRSESKLLLFNIKYKSNKQTGFFNSFKLFDNKIKWKNVFFFSNCFLNFFNYHTGLVLRMDVVGQGDP